MSEENDNHDEGANPPGDSAPAPEAKPEERTFTQAELDAKIAARLAKAERKWRKDSEVKSAPQKEQPKPPEGNSEVLSKLAELQAKLEMSEKKQAFAEALSQIPNANQLTKRQRDVLERDFDPEEPERTVQDAKELFGVAADSPQTGAKAASPDAPKSLPEGVASQYVSPGASAGRPDEPSSNPLEWTRDDIARLQRDGTFLQRVEEWRMRAESGGNALFRKPVPGA